MSPQYDAITGGDTLRIPAIQSPNFVTGVSGWIIKADGTAEFNSGTFRGSIQVGTVGAQEFIVNNPSTGDVIDIYNSSGKLIFSLNNAAVTEWFANSAGTGTFTLTPSGLSPSLVWDDTAHSPQSKPTIDVSIDATHATLSLLSGAHSGQFGSAISLFEGTGGLGNARAQVTRNSTTGDIVMSQNGGVNDNIFLFHAATSTVDLGGGLIGAQFSHGAPFTPVGGIIMPYDGPSASNLYTYNVESFTSTLANVSTVHADGTTPGLGEGVECFGMVWI